jgi:pilus assembly protein CpaE
MKDVQRIAIVDPSDATREELRNVLLGMEDVWLESECARYEFFFDVIQQSHPDVVVISLDSDQSKALQLISQLAAQVPEMPILAISARGDGQAILQALRSGAREFLTVPVVLEELIKALQRLRRTTRVTDGGRVVNEPTNRVESMVIAVLGSRGGVGSTTLAVNLGATLAMDPAHSVALVDLDLALGDTHVCLDLMTDYTLADVALNVDRLDMQFLKRSLSKHASGLSLLPRPELIEDAGLIREDHLQRVIGLLRASYTHLVLDLSKGFSPNDITALRMADVILLVAQLDLSSLHNTVRMLMSLGNDDSLINKVQIVLNRVGSGETEITPAQAAETISKPIHWQIPNDPRPILDSRNQGLPLVQHAPRTKAQVAIVALASAICGKELQPTKDKGIGWKLFSRG